MNRAVSTDGTEIAYDKVGDGPAVIVVDGAITFRGFGSSQQLAQLLAPHFSVYTYDRRGRGESGDTQPFAVTREVEDIEALALTAGGTAFVYGISSGGCLALEAAIQLGEKVGKLAIYEAPYNADPADRPQWHAYRAKLKELLAAGQRGEAVAAFMKFVGTPAEMVEGMRQSPMWPTFESIAPTLAYDAAVIGDDRTPPLERANQVTVPALMLDGGANLAHMPFMHNSAAALAQAMPHGRQRTLEGQTHDVKLDVLAPVLIEFFSQ